MADLFTTVREASELLRQISDTLGYTVRLSYRQPDIMMDYPLFAIAIEGNDLPFGGVRGSEPTMDEALDVALAKLPARPMARAA